MKALELGPGISAKPRGRGGSGGPRGFGVRGGGGAAAGIGGARDTPGSGRDGDNRAARAGRRRLGDMEGPGGLE